MKDAQDHQIFFQTITPRKKTLGGLYIKRLLPTTKRKMVGPWIFFDHFGPNEFAPGEGVNVRPHPHINLATVSYLFAGELLHRDSIGSQQSISPGDINLMIAGRGIVHSEGSNESIQRTGQTIHGLQLWLALPEEYEEIEPAFYHYPAVNIPSALIKGVPIRLIMGAAYSLSSPVKTFARTLYIEAELAKGQSLTLPQEQQLAIYPIEGSIAIEGNIINQYEMASVDTEQTLTMEACADSRVIVIGGEAMPQRFIDWNFVSSSKDRIEKAKHDWSEQLFDKVVGDDSEAIPYPENNTH